jgi:hypothetical protein
MSSRFRIFRMPPAPGILPWCSSGVCVEFDLMKQPLGSLRPIAGTEDRTLYAYRPRRRTARGAAWTALALLLVAGASVVALRVGGFVGWPASIVLLLTASGAAFCGLLDLLNRPLFQIEVDRRARTLALMVPREQGQALLKVQFGNVVSVELKEQGAPPTWNVTLLIEGGRRIGLGVSDDRAESEAIATQFAELIGVELVRLP